MNPITVRTSRRKVAPRWLTDGEGGLVGYALDIVKDAFLERVRQSLLIRFPQQGPDGTPAPDDALTAMGRDRLIVRGRVETSAAYAVRLLKWLDDHAKRGSAYALLQKVWEWLGLAIVLRTVDRRGNWYTRNNTVESALLNQGDWNWDGDVTKWSRFWVIIYPNSFWSSEGTYGDGALWGDAGSWGTTATQEEVHTIKSLVATWKPAGTRCPNIIIAFDNSSFTPGAGEPDGNWLHWSKLVAGVQVPARLETARYWDGF